MSDLGGSENSLAARFRRLIRRHGPIPVAQYMGESNALYYAARDPLGAAGDFVTAPEISQMFGEIAGLWLTDIWTRAGRPADPLYAELGPGRGTLVKDALRAMAIHGLIPAVHLIEGSRTLRQVQSGALTGARFHDGLDTLPEAGPLLLVANEFLDALPIRQLVRTERGWRERMVALDDDEFVFAAGPQPMDCAVPPELLQATVGTVIETCPAAAALIDEVVRRLGEQGGAALFIDYGHLEPRTGSTLQAVQRHRKVDVFAAPGEADLTAHVDFAMLAARARRAGLRVSLAAQGSWLRALGLGARAAALAARSPGHTGEIMAARDRLAGEDAMGALFKVMALTPRGWPEPAGF